MTEEERKKQTKSHRLKRTREEKIDRAHHVWRKGKNKREKNFRWGPHGEREY